MKQLTIGISYSIEQEKDVFDFVEELKKLKLKYFLDKENNHLFWGEYMPEALNKQYRSFDYVVAFVSKEYLKKAYPNFEMEVSFHEQMHKQNSYFLPIIYDGVTLPHYYRGRIGLKRNDYTIPQIAEILNKKISTRSCDKVLLRDIIKKTIKQDSLLKEKLTLKGSCKDFMITTNKDNFCILEFQFDSASDSFEVKKESPHGQILAKIYFSQDTDKIKILNYNLFDSAINECDIIKFAELITEVLYACV